MVIVELPLSVNAPAIPYISPLYIQKYYFANVAGLSILTLSGRGQVAVGAPGPGGAPRPVSLQLLTSLVIS